MFAIGMGGGVGSIAMMSHRRLLAVFMLSAGWITSHLSRRRFERRRHPGDRHGVTQLTDDQTGHQQENQGPALPAEFTHGARLQANVAARNDVRIKSRSFSEAPSYIASAVLQNQR
ncbi:MAG TPA: hypothetical protein VIU34_06260 [Steroidobacter sp.]